MLDLLEMQKSFILSHLKPGGVAVDYTMGNGHDTLFLSQTVGASGKVYAFDIQADAVTSTARNLENNKAPSNWTLIHDSHHNAGKYVAEKVNAGMFNLGWLPYGNKSITTKRETTLPAIEQAINRMSNNAVLIIAVYPGHPEGDAEGKAIREYLSSLNRKKLMCGEFHIVNSPTSPFFFVVETK